MTESILTPVLALVAWTLIMWLVMYATRIPAMSKSGVDAAKIKRASDLDGLPMSAKQIADNYNHLHEQPVIFYALAFYTHTIGTADAFSVNLAWAYVGLRVVHSLIQSTVNFVPVRFLVFSLSSLALLVLTIRNLLAL
ncbi:MAG: MAPEG family protein [Pseudomonadota bacterium]